MSGVERRARLKGWGRGKLGVALVVEFSRVDGGVEGRGLTGGLRLILRRG